MTFRKAHHPAGCGEPGRSWPAAHHCFKQICLDGKPVQQVLDAQARTLNGILDQLKVPCWRPDPVTAGQQCRVQ